jgi:hypothetical protein
MHPAVEDRYVTLIIHSFNPDAEITTLMLEEEFMPNAQTRTMLKMPLQALQRENRRALWGEPVFHF